MNSTDLTALARVVEHDIKNRLSAVKDPELGRSITDLGMVTDVKAVARDAFVSGKPAFDVTVCLELTAEGCPLTQTIIDNIDKATVSYPAAAIVPHIDVSSMSKEKLASLVSRLRAERNANPFNREDSKTRIFAVASGKGGVGKSSVTANLAAAFASMGKKTAVIDADIYGFSIPGLFGVSQQPSNVGGMLIPIEKWGVRLMSIGMFAGADKPILWRGPRLARSLEQFLSDVWWDEPDILLLDMAPGTGDMTLAVAQALPNAQMLIVTTPQLSAWQIAARAGLASLQLPVSVRGVIENMSATKINGQRTSLFGEGGGQKVSDVLTEKLGVAVPLLGQIPFDPSVREIGETGRPAVLNEQGSLSDSPLAQTFINIAQSLLED